MLKYLYDLTCFILNNKERCRFTFAQVETINPTVMINCILFHLNPVAAGIVIKPEDWEYNSARDFNGMKGLIDLSYSS